MALDVLAMGMLLFAFSRWLFRYFLFSASIKFKLDASQVKRLELDVSGGGGGAIKGLDFAAILNLLDEEVVGLLSSLFSLDSSVNNSCDTSSAPAQGVAEVDRFAAGWFADKLRSGVAERFLLLTIDFETTNREEADAKLG